MRILLVEVGHGGHEPAVVHLVEVVAGSIRVNMRSQFERSLYKAVFVVGIVEPVFGGHVLNPYMLYTAVVENHVHYDFDAACMGFFNQLLVFFVGTEARVYFIVVCGGIAVIGTASHVVLQYRSKPEGCDAKVGEIVEVLFDAGKVTTVAGIGVIAVYLVLGHACNLVVVRIAIGKAVGHQQVQGIGGVESLVFATFLIAGLQFIFLYEFLFPFSKGEVDFSGFHVFVEFQIDQEVVVAFQLDGAAQ